MYIVYMYVAFQINFTEGNIQATSLPANYEPQFSWLNLTAHNRASPQQQPVTVNLI